MPSLELPSEIYEKIGEVKPGTLPRKCAVCERLETCKESEMDVIRFFLPLTIKQISENLMFFDVGAIFNTIPRFLPGGNTVPQTCSLKKEKL